jgi:16S rRNA (guanine(966)-N(2))-methyltransferase RsmD
VREALFDVLGPRIAGAAFADLFAGSGAVGLEAWSRGADRVILVEADREAAASLRRTVARLGAGGVHVVRATLPTPRLRGLAAGTFQVVFADPPYRFGRTGRLLETAGALLAPGGVLVLEHAEGEGVPAAAGDLRLESSRRYGESRLSFYRADSATVREAEPSDSRK